MQMKDKRHPLCAPVGIIATQLLMQMKDKRHPYYALRIIMCQSSSPKLPKAVDTHVISPVSFLSLASVKDERS